MELIYRDTKKSGVLAKLIMAIFGTFLLAFSGKIRIFLPFTPVPITAQTFTLFLLAISLSFSTCVLTLLFYVLYLTTFLSPAVFVGPTGGYLLGFVIAGILLNYFFDRAKWIKKPSNLLFVLIFVNFFIIHALGLLGLGFYLKNYNLYQLFLLGSAPFIIGDLLKIFLVIFIYRLIYFSRTY